MDILAHSALLTLLPLEPINLVYPFLTGSKWLNIGFLREPRCNNNKTCTKKPKEKELQTIYMGEIDLLNKAFYLTVKERRIS